MARRWPQTGFSLLEMIVALVILSFSLIVLYQATSNATRNVRLDERFVYATLIAESLLAEHPAVTEGGMDRGGEVDDFRWQLTARPFQAARRGAIPLYTLQAEVSWVEAGYPKDRQVRLVTVVPQESES